MKSKFLNVVLLALPFLIVGCGESKTVIQAAVTKTEETRQITKNSTSLTVYKSATCGCCQKWIDHVEEAGIKVNIEHPHNLSALKDRLDIGKQYRSCHTGVTENGYVFEGHIPARYIQQFLNNPPADAIGLSVPGMPVGSPGMEFKEKFMPYQIHLLKKDGTSELFALVDDPSQQ